MSENRSRYSSAPLHDMRRRPPKPPEQTPRDNRPDDSSPNGSHIFLQVLLIVVLPLLFVISLFMKSNRFYWVFVVSSLVCLGMMYLMRAFVPNA
ncbi:MAG TPA: hypothetical protein PKZ39_02810, partial [Clostridia bacterium]|nr:hypothetical protein [Clostridia bacterium]